MKVDEGSVSDFVTVITVSQLLADTSLCIPDYQRPYKWTQANIDRLLADLGEHIGLVGPDESLPEYRLGTIVLHQRERSENAAVNVDIVDGQQRYLSLLLIVHSLLNGQVEDRSPRWTDNGEVALASLRKSIAGMLERLTFSSEISHRNLTANYAHIRQRLGSGGVNERFVELLLTRCTLVRCTLTKLPEAFQFFDAQNARGKPLRPHDLLKAFHLRELERLSPAGMSGGDVPDEVVRRWEKSGEAELSELFGHYLARIRRWQRGELSSRFRREDIGLFKGFTPGQKGTARYSQPLQLIHDQCCAPEKPEAFPFLLDQPIVNGQRFFEWVDHYLRELASIRASAGKSMIKARVERDGNERAAKILEVIDTYQGHERVGDGYVRELFNAFLLAYMDRFGWHDLPRAIESGFVWAWTLRLRLERVSWQSVENRAMESKLFLILRDATNSQDVLRVMQPEAGKGIQVRFQGAQEIRQMFPDGLCHD